MAYIAGTVVGGLITPGNDTVSYGTHLSKLGVGGFVEVLNNTERDAIPVDSQANVIIGGDKYSSGRRRLGMMVYVRSTNMFYQLLDSAYETYSTDTQRYTSLANNSNWKQALTVGDDTIYGSGWNGSLLSPTQNSVYDKIQSMYNDFLPIAGGTLTGEAFYAGTPTSPNSLVNKAYADSILSNIQWKNKVVAATTGNITLSGTQTIDGIAVIAGDRVLVKNQSTASQNGIYIVSAGSWTRSTDANTAGLIYGATMGVLSGTANANHQFTNSTPNPITLGTTGINFVDTTGGTSYVNGDGMLLTGNSFSVDTSVVRTTGAQTLAGVKTFSNTPVFSTMTAGSVLFAGVSGQLSQDNTNFFWDNTNKRIGLGTNTPASRLNVVGNTSEPNLVLKNASSTPGNSIEIRSAADVILSAFNNNGDLLFTPTTNGIKDLTNNNYFLEFTGVASGINHFGITNAVTGSSPSINSLGTDPNINFTINPKGTGYSILGGTQATKIASGTTAQEPGQASQSTPVNGMLRYDVTTNKFRGYQNSAWVDLISAGTITSLNGSSAATQTFVPGTTGTDFNIITATGVHTFNFPIASASNTGKLSNTDWTSFNNRLPLTGGTLTGPLILSADPTTNLQAATKQYVDSFQPAAVWSKVRVATTTSGTLTTAFVNGATVDGITLVTGDRILIKNQSSAIENGVYTVNASGSPTRATDYNTNPRIVNATVIVSEGTANAEKVFTCSNDVVTIGSTNITFVQIAGTNLYTNGTGVSIAGNVISIDGTVVTTTGAQTITGQKTFTGGIIYNTTGDTTGDILYRNSGGVLTRLGVGTTGQFIGVSSGLPAWTNLPTLLTTKGDLYSYSTQAVRLSVGADNTLLVADSTASAGLSYKTISQIIGFTPQQNVKTLKETITASNTFVAGDVVRYSAGSFVKAQANNTTNAEAIGIIESATSTQFTIVYSGIISLSGLTPDTMYYLSDATAGLLTSTKPVSVGSFIKPLVVASSSSSANLVNYLGTQIVTGGASGTSIRETFVISNTFAAGNVIRYNAGGFAKSQADSESNAEVIGIVESATSTQFTVVYAGDITLSGLTQDGIYYLSEVTAGLLTLNEPTSAGTVSKPILSARNTTQGIVINYRGSLNGVSTGGGGGTAISPLTTKGDIWGFNTVDTRVSVGADNTVLVADSTNTNGVSYKTIPTILGYVPERVLGNPTQDGYILSSTTTGVRTWIPNSASNVNNGVAGKLALYPANGSLVDDSFIQNSRNIDLGIVAQPTRTAAITYSIPNPGDAISAANFLLTEGAQTINGTQTFTGTSIYSALTANLPLQLNGSKNVISSAINLNSAQVTGLLPITGLQNISSNTLLGRFSASSGNVEVITLGSGFSVAGGVLNYQPNTLKETFTTSNTFIAGNIVKYSAGSFVLAKADTIANAEAVGIIESATSTQFTIVYSGIISLTSLIADAVYYLSDTAAGTLTTTEPTIPGVVSKPLLIAKSSTIGLVVNFRGVTVQNGSGGGGGGTAISPLTTKGDLWGFNTGDTRVQVGTAGTVLSSDPTTGTGLSYKTIPALLGYTPEQALGSPSTNGYVLSSTTTGVRSWIPNATGNVGSGVAGNLGLYPSTGSAIDDVFVQNGQNITVSIATQASRTTGLSYILNNPGNGVSTTNLMMSSSVLSQYSIPFVGPNGVITEDNYSLFWDSANKTSYVRRANTASGSYKPLSIICTDLPNEGFEFGFIDASGVSYPRAVINTNTSTNPGVTASIKHKANGNDQLGLVFSNSGEFNGATAGSSAARTSTIFDYVAFDYIAGFSSAGVNVRSLVGTGTRMVVATSNGLLQSQAIPTGFSGSYTDLTNKPTLSTVAGSGSYTDLINKPTIPTTTSQLTNNSGFLTSAVTSVTASVTSSTALTVPSTPITTTGNLAFTWTGTSAQYIRGNGTLASFPTLTGNYVPLTGTVSGSPVTDNVSFSDDKGISSSVIPNNQIVLNDTQVFGVSGISMFSDNEIDLVVGDRNFTDATALFTLGVNNANIYIQESGGVFSSFTQTTSQFLFQTSSGTVTIDGSSIKFNGSTVNVPGGSYTYNFPGKSGTVALLSDLTNTNPLTTKGDLYGFSSISTRVPVGSNNSILTADSTTSTGLAYKTIATILGYVPAAQGIYLPLAGGTMTGDIAMSSGVLLKSSSSSSQYLNIQDTTGITLNAGNANLKLISSSGGTIDRFLFSTNSVSASDYPLEVKSTTANATGGLFVNFVNDTSIPSLKIISGTGGLGLIIRHRGFTSAGNNPGTSEIVPSGDLRFLFNVSNLNKVAFSNSSANVDYVSIDSNGVNLLGGNGVKFYNSGNTNYISLSSPVISSNYNYTLPANYGSNGQVLTSNGAGSLSWTTISGGGGSGTGTGTVTSVSSQVTPGTALTVAGGPITTSGSLNFSWTGSATQYVKGNGVLATFPTNVSSFTNDAGYITSATATPPGGSTTQIQFNNSGAFAGDANFTFNPVTSVFRVNAVTRLNTTGGSALLNIQGSGGLAPIQIVGAGLITTPINGSLEYDGNHYYGTVGGTRLQLDNQIQAIGGTTSQYIRGNGTLATFPTNISSFNNDIGYITGMNPFAVGSSPNDNAMTISGTFIALQPFDASHPGVMNTLQQTWSGDKHVGQNGPNAVNNGNNNKSLGSPSYKFSFDCSDINQQYGTVFDPAFFIRATTHLVNGNGVSAFNVGTAYSVGNYVTYSGGVYICNTAHTSGTSGSYDSIWAQNSSKWTFVNSANLRNSAYSNPSLTIGSSQYSNTLRIFNDGTVSIGDGLGNLNAGGVITDIVQGYQNSTLTVGSGTNVFKFAYQNSFVNGPNSWFAPTCGLNSVVLGVDGIGNGTGIDDVDIYFSPKLNGKNIMDGRVQLNKGINLNYNFVTSNYTILITDSLLFVDTTSGPITLTMPDAASSGGQIIRVIKTAGANNITFATQGSDVILNQSGILATVNTKRDIICSSAKWYGY
jgi:hypothetical protein